MSEGLLERETEMAALDGLLASAAGGRGGVLVIEGAAGLGKSALLRELADRGRTAPAQVLTAIGGELERDFPFGMVRQLLEPLVLAATPERRDELLCGSAALAAPVLGAARGPEATSADASFATLHGLYWLVAALSDEQPLVLILDDVHWADAPSLRFADFLARRVSELPVLLAVALRPREPGAELELLQGLLDGPHVEILRPDALSPAAVGELVASRLPESAADTVGAAHETTGGNPLLLRELLGSLDRGGHADAAAVHAAVPSSVARSVEHRLARLGAETRTVATALAVLGDRRATALIGDVTGIEPRAVERSLDGLRAIELVDRESSRYVHPLVRQAVSETVPLGERHDLHRRAVEALRERPGPADELVVHLLAIPPIDEPWVVELLREAARRALTEGAPDAAIRRLSRAVEESGPQVDPALLLELGLAEASVGLATAAGHLDEAATRGAPVVAGTAVLARESLGLLAVSVDGTAMADSLQTAIDRLGPDGPPQLLSDLYGTLINALTMDCRFADRRSRVLAETRELDWATLLGARALDAACTDVPAGVVIDQASRALEARPLTELLSLEHLSVWGVVACGAVDGRDLADAAIHDAEATARRHGSRLARAFAAGMRCEWALAFGAPATAEAHAREAHEYFIDVGLGNIVATASATLTEALVLLDRLDEAEATIGSVTLADHMWGNGYVLEARAAVRIAQKRFAEAVTDLRGVQALCDRFGWRQFTRGQARSRLAIALAGAGERDEAIALASGEVDFGVRTGRGSAELAGRIALGRALGGAEGVEALRMAVEAAPRSASPVLRAEALVDYGAALRRSKQRAEAREVLREGHDAAAAIDARALAARALEELVVAGAKPRRALASGVESLTPSERRVAEHAARGLSNREIAETLFVTRKTVELHLGRTYAKLEIRSRAQLAGVLGEVPADVGSPA